MESPKATDNEDYGSWSKEDLIEKIRKLTCRVKQLQNVIKRDNCDSNDERCVKKAKRSRDFDFSRHPKRHVALKIAYLGWDYQGLAVQEDTNNTIESHLFEALTRSKLIEQRSTSNYHRCGRTDKGVSAFCQVISIDLRSKCNSGLGVIVSHCAEYLKDAKIVADLEQEIDYCKILNAILPKEIRVLAWAPVRTGFSARFDCKERVYRYFVPVGGADLNAMRQAGAHLIGEHDYQNFCKVDKSVEKTVRRINSFSITKCNPATVGIEDKYEIYEIEIRGQAFLWHQIRCIVAVLILVGKRLESPEIIQDLLDLEKTPLKPQYSMAMDYPLVLFDTNHGMEIKEWICNPNNTAHVMIDLQTIWSQLSLKAQMVRTMLKSLEQDCIISNKPPNEHVSGSVSIKWVPPPDLSSIVLPDQQLDCLVMGVKTKVYKSLSARPVCGHTQN